MQLLASIAALALAVEAGKRGLVGVTTATSAIDNAVFIKSDQLSWVYTYGVSPPSGSQFGSLPFVPQQWGGYGLSIFQSAVSAQNLKEKYVLGFNEPDGVGNGQANMLPAAAASAWKTAIQPLKAQGFKLGSPGVTGAPSGMVWMKEFMGNCSGCSIDFLALHWYGNYDGLVSHLNNYRTNFPDLNIWITELALPDNDASTTLKMMQDTLAYLDNATFVDRYTWFGSFRSSQSNVGPNAAFLDASGKLTTLGSTYLGLSAQSSKASTSGSSRTAMAPAVVLLAMFLTTLI
jgi:hypothetical protein